MNTNEQTQLLDCLQSLLERQIELAQQANIGDVELLSEQTTCLVEKIAQTGVLESAEFENRREQLQKLYHDLHLAITAQRDETGETLSRVRRGKKTVEAYGNNI
jgi:cell division protein FtsX